MMKAQARRVLFVSGVACATVAQSVAHARLVDGSTVLFNESRFTCTSEA
jgi:hypothetical protein